MQYLLVFLFLVVSCGKAEDEPEPTPSTPTIEERFDHAEARVQPKFLEGGWVVSRRPDGSAEHQGEGLLWSAQWIGVASCAAGDAVEATLQDMIVRHAGALVRIEPLGEYDDGRQVTLDGALGLYHGVADRVRRCPESRASWYDVMRLHQRYVEVSGGRLHPNASTRLIPEFNYVLARLVDYLSGGSSEHRDNARLDRFMVESAGWVAIVNATHEAGYRAHLVLLAWKTLEIAGDDVERGRDAICAASRGMDMPTLDHWCGRGDLIGWIDVFKYNVWEYRHQRAGAWETPDGKDNESPAIDLLRAIRDAYVLLGGR